ncbi:MAG: 2-phospho-L-lactate transferase CofD family protein, partial [Candidatus Omnitrophota bacterium]
MLSNLSSLKPNDPLSSWLKDNYNKNLDEQLSTLDLTLKQKARLNNWVNIRDSVISYSRSLRLAYEVMLHYQDSYQKAGLSLNRFILDKISRDKTLLGVITGIYPAAFLNRKSWTNTEISLLKELLFVYSQIEDKIINLMPTADGRILAYSEYLLKDYFLKNKEAAYTKVQTEHLINLYLASGKSSFIQLSSVSSLNKLLSLAKPVLLIHPESSLASWLSKYSSWASTGFGRGAWELHRSNLDAKTLDTKDRPRPVEPGLICELDNQGIFNQPTDIVVIDDESNQANLEQYHKVLEQVKEETADRKAGELVFMPGSSKQAAVKHYAQFIARLWQSILDAKLDPGIVRILTEPKFNKKTGQEYIIAADGIIDVQKLEFFIRDNPLYHISGIRNYTILLLASQGAKVIMNFDDDAQPENYVLFLFDRNTLASYRSKKEQSLLSSLMQEISLRLNINITDLKSLYKVWAANREELADLELQYFGYDGTDNSKGLILKALDQVIPLSGPRPARFTEEGLEVTADKSSFLAKDKDLTYQRYEGLAWPLPANNIALTDFIYPEPRIDKQGNRYMTLPVNVARSAELIGKRAGDLPYMYIDGDLRGTMGVPAKEDTVQEWQDRTIIYSQHPFVFDHDNSGEAAARSWMAGDDMSIFNMQHTGRSSIIGDGNIRAFISDTYVIFNRASLSIKDPTPSIGQTLRLEEPPFIKWIGKLLSKYSTITCFAPVAGGQQRDIGARFYMIPFQDYNEVVGTAARSYYEKAVELFGRRLRAYPDKLDNYSNELYSLLGSSYIDIANGSVLDDNARAYLLKERLSRARMLSDLAFKRAVKLNQLNNLGADPVQQSRLARELSDIDLIMARYAIQFYMYQPKNIQDKERTNFTDDHSPLDASRDYFLKITRKGPDLEYEAVYPNIALGQRSDVTNPAPVSAEWANLGSKGKVSIDSLKDNTFKLDSREVVLTSLPEEGQAIIVPTLPYEYEDAYLALIQKQLFGQIRQDGETIYMWPYLVRAAKDGEGSSPVGKESRSNELCAPDDFTRRFFQAIGFARVVEHKGLSFSTSSPLNIVLFRGGRGAGALTQLLKNIPGVNVSIILAATDDGRSWYTASQDFNATGMPDCGKSLLDLATDEQVKKVLELRMKGQDSLLLKEEFNRLLDKLNGNTPVEFTLPETKKLYDSFLSITDTQKQKELLSYLVTFRDTLKHKFSNSGFTYNDIPVRSIALVGAAWRLALDKDPSLSSKALKDIPTWQAASARIAHLLGVRDGHQVIFTTLKRKHLMAMLADGTIYFTETGINEHPKTSEFLGLWLMNRKLDINLFAQNIKERISVELEEVGIPEKIKEDGLRKEIDETTRKLKNKGKALDVAKYIASLSITGCSRNGDAAATPEAIRALEEADAIIYCTTTLESNMGAGLIVKDVQEAIRNNKKAVKLHVCNPTIENDLPDTTALSMLERLYRYVSNKQLYRKNHLSWEDASDYVHYILGIGAEFGLMQDNYKPENGQEILRKSPIVFNATDIRSVTGNQVIPLGCDLEIKTPELKQKKDYSGYELQFGLYSPKVIEEVILELLEPKGAAVEIGSSAADHFVSSPVNKELRLSLGVLGYSSVKDFKTGLEEKFFLGRDLVSLQIRLTNLPDEQKQKIEGRTNKYLEVVARGLASAYGKPLTQITPEEFNSEFGMTLVVPGSGEASRFSSECIISKSMAFSGIEETYTRLALGGGQLFPALRPVITLDEKT